MNRKFYFRVVSVALVLGMLLGACGGSSYEGPAGEPINEPAEEPAATELPPVLDATNLGATFEPGRVVLANDLLLLSPELIAQMEPANEESDTITAAQLDATDGAIKFVMANPQAFSRGQIISTGITEETPYGLLRKVVDVNEVGNDVLVITEQATLEEVIEEGTISTNTESMILSSNEIERYSKGNGLMMVIPNPMTGEINIQLEDAVLLDYGQDQKLVASGGIVITPGFDLDIEMDKFSVKRFRFSNKTSINADIQVKSDINIVDVEIPFLVYKYPYKPITIMVGELPVVITPILNVYVGFDGKVTAGFSTGLKYTNDLERGIFRENGQWGVIKPASQPIFTPIKPTIKTVATATVYVQPYLEILVFGVVGPYGWVKGYIQLAINPQKDPWWTMSTVVIAEVGVEFKIFSFLKKLAYVEPFEIYKKIFEPAPAEPPPAEESPEEPAPTEEPAEPEEPNPQPGNENPPDTSPPAGTGNENVLLIYNSNSVNVINISSGQITVKGVTFRRIDNQGNETASYPAEIWGSYYSNYDTLPPNYCLRVALPDTTHYADCIENGNFETRQTQFYFWIAISNSRQFQVWQNNTLIKTCEISAGACRVYLPQN